MKLSLKYLFFIGVSLSALSQRALAQGFDFGTELRLGYPLTGGLIVKSGYGLLLYGKPNTPGQKSADTNFLYGFVRPNIRASTAVVVNRAEARLDVYPISIAGLTVGRAISYRSADSGDFDCVTLSCRSTLNRSFVESKFVAGYGHLFVLFGLRYDWLSSAEVKNGFRDEASDLVGNGSSDTLRELSGVLGIMGMDPWKLTFSGESLRMTKSQQSSYTLAPTLSYQWDTYNQLSLRVGKKHSTSLGDEVFSVLQWAWTPKRSLEL